MPWMWPPKEVPVLRDSPTRVRPTAVTILKKVREGKIGIYETDQWLDRTLLMLASSGGLTEEVKWLLAAGADVHARDKTGATALMHAVYDNYLPVVQLLVEAGAHINDADNIGRLVFIQACQQGNPAMRRFLLERGADINATDRFGYTALTSTAASITDIDNDFRVLLWLLEAGANVSNGDSVGTALLFACRRGLLAMAKYLVAVGADVNATDANGDCPIVTAAQATYCPDHFALVQVLLHAGADVNAAQQGKTALIAACQEGDIAEIATLVEYGADVNAKDNEGKTPLTWAAKRKALPAMVYLTAVGADINHADARRETVLMVACKEDVELLIVTHLLHLGVNVHARDHKCRIALTFAANAKAFHAVQKLLAAGGVAVVR